MPEPAATPMAALDGDPGACTRSWVSSRPCSASSASPGTSWRASGACACCGTPTSSGCASPTRTGSSRANDAFLAITGHDRAALDAGEVNWRELTPPEWGPADDRALEDLRVHGRAEPYEKEFLRTDGARTPVLVGAVTLELRPARMMAIFLDLSARRAAEREREALLAREREARREAELAAGRIARLQRITAALSAAISADDVAQLVVEAAVEALGAAAGVVALREGDELAVRRQSGYEDGLIEGWRASPSRPTSRSRRRSGPGSRSCCPTATPGSATTAARRSAAGAATRRSWPSPACSTARRWGRWASPSRRPAASPPRSGRS